MAALPDLSCMESVMMLSPNCDDLMLENQVKEGLKKRTAVKICVTNYCCSDKVGHPFIAVANVTFVLNTRCPSIFLAA